MTKELATNTTTSLAIASDQQQFTDQQIDVLRHMGLEKAPAGDLDVFFHVAKRSGLDPFARQIYMIGRWSKDGTKYTIQTGIDGYRVIGHRAASQHGQSVAERQPEWLHEDGSWRPAWSKRWGQPIAARVSIVRDGNEFTAVANFEEYAQTKRDGGLTQMWEQRPAGQIAKCAEALAWRMAFPQDLAGFYVDEEMDRANSEPKQAERPTVTADAFTGEVLDGEVVEHADAAPAPSISERIDAIATPQQARELWASLNAAGELTEPISDAIKAKAAETETAGQ